MNPNECLSVINDLVKSKDVDDIANRWCWDLFKWIKGGGLEPDWNKYPAGSLYYHCRMEEWNMELWYRI